MFVLVIAPREIVTRCCCGRLRCSRVNLAVLLGCPLQGVLLEQKGPDVSPSLYCVGDNSLEVLFGMTS